jgi:hypothetical protein
MAQLGQPLRIAPFELDQSVVDLTAEGSSLAPR